jgi:hypothetical protein
MPRLDREAWAMLRLTMNDIGQICERLDQEVGDGLA